MLDLFEPQAASSGVEIVRYLDPDLPSIQLNGETLQAALVNLVKNALEAMPDGGQLVARTRVTRQGVALDLIDTGCGMDERTAMKMFDAFYTHQERRQRPGPAHRPPDHRSPRRPDRRPQRSRPRHAVHAGVPDAGTDWGVRGSAEFGLRIADSDMPGTAKYKVRSTRY